MYCKKCGSKLNDNSTICSNCGENNLNDDGLNIFPNSTVNNISNDESSKYDIINEKVNNSLKFNNYEPQVSKNRTKKSEKIILLLLLIIIIIISVVITLLIINNKKNKENKEKQNDIPQTPIIEPIEEEKQTSIIYNGYKFELIGDYTASVDNNKLIIRIKNQKIISIVFQQNEKITLESFKNQMESKNLNIISSEETTYKNNIWRIINTSSKYENMEQYYAYTTFNDEYLIIASVLIESNLKDETFNEISEIIASAVEYNEEESTQEETNSEELENIEKDEIN